MRKRTARILLKASLPLNVFLFAWVLYDYFGNDSHGMDVVLGTYAAFLVALIILLLLSPQPPFVRMSSERGAKRTISYGKHHGKS